MAQRVIRALLVGDEGRLFSKRPPLQLALIGYPASRTSLIRHWTRRHSYASLSMRAANRTFRLALLVQQRIAKKINLARHQGARGGKQRYDLA